MMANLGALLTPHVLISLAIPAAELWDIKHVKRRMMRWLAVEALPLSSRCSKAVTMDRPGMLEGRKESKDVEISQLAKWEAYLLAKEMVKATEEHPGPGSDSAGFTQGSLLVEGCNLGNLYNFSPYYA
eukprot:Gb_40466 [translate_table: standard]